MPKTIERTDPEERIDRGPQSALEKRFIGAYLRGKGYRLEDLRQLPREEANRLMEEACLYASLRLTQIEAVAGFCKKIQSEHD
jgi:hypothetical protein